MIFLVSKKTNQHPTKWDTTHTWQAGPFRKYNTDWLRCLQPVSIWLMIYMAIFHLFAEAKCPWHWSMAHLPGHHTNLQLLLIRAQPPSDTNVHQRPHSPMNTSPHSPTRSQAQATPVEVGIPAGIVHTTHCQQWPNSIKWGTSLQCPCFHWSLLSPRHYHSPEEAFIFLCNDQCTREKRTYTQNLYPGAYGKLDKEHSKRNKLHRQGCFRFYYQPCLCASAVLFEAARVLLIMASLLLISMVMWSPLCHWLDVC